MRLVRIALSLALMFQVSSELCAQQSSVAVMRDPQAIAILIQTITTAGGAAVIGSVQDFVASGSITYFWGGTELPGSVTVRGKGLKKFRMDATLSTGVRSLVVNESNGSISGSIKEASGVSTVIPYHNAVNFGSLTFPVVHILAALGDLATNIRYLGLVTIDGQQFHQIRLEPFATEGDPGNMASKLNSKDFLIDPTTFQIASVLEMLHPDGDSSTDVSREIRFSQYQITGGLLIPFSMTEKIQGQRTWTIQLGQISFNSGLLDTEFQL